MHETFQRRSPNWNGSRQAELRSWRKQECTRQDAREKFSLVLAAALAVGLVAPAIAADDAWHDIRRDVFDNREIVEDETVTLEAPYRAEDAATVPLTMRIPASSGDGQEPHAGHRQEPGPRRRQVHLRRSRRQRRAHAVDARAHRHVFQRPRRRRNRRRQAAHGDEVRESLRRLLGGGVEGRRRGARQSRQDAGAHLRRPGR